MDYYIPAAVVLAWVIAHITKEIAHVIKEGKFSWYALLFQTGGMPSSHSSSVTALSTAVFLQDGFTTLFWVSAVFTIVVVRDAFGVRKSVSDQAEFLNILMGRANLHKKVKVVLGHTPLQVAAGVGLGFFTSLILWLVW